MSSESGFTLIETLAAGLISTIVAGAMLSVLTMTTRQLKESSTSLNLGQIQGVVTDQLRSDARKAFGARGDFETPNGAFTIPNTDAARSNQTEIIFCDKGGTSFSRYRIRSSDSILEEWVDGAYTPFLVGNQAVHLDVGATKSRFGILANRFGVTFKLTCRVQTDKGFAFFPALEDTVLGRDLK